MEEPAVMTLAELITSLLSFFTSAFIPNLTTLASTIVGSPFLLLTTAIMVAGAIIGLFKRVLRAYQ